MVIIDHGIKTLMTMVMMKKGLMTMRQMMTVMTMTKDFVSYKFVVLQDIGDTEGRGLEP